MHASSLVHATRVIPEGVVFLSFFLSFFVGDLRYRQQKAWKDAAGLDHCVMNRKVVH